MLAKRLFHGYLLWATITVSLAFAQNVHREIVVGDDDREPAPRFHAKTLAGEQFSNESTKGKIILFQFWTT